MAASCKVQNLDPLEGESRSKKASQKSCHLNWVLKGARGSICHTNTLSYGPGLVKSLSRSFVAWLEGHINARWQRALIRSNPSSGTGRLDREASSARKDTDQICVCESPLRGRWRTEQRARLEARSPSSQPSETRAGLGLVSSSRTKMPLFSLFFFFLKSPVVPKIELV